MNLEDTWGKTIPGKEEEHTQRLEAGSRPAMLLEEQKDH